MTEPFVQPQETSTPAAVPAPTSARSRTGASSPFVWGTGRRKTAVARVRVKPGGGKFLINNREVDAFFHLEQDRASVLSPLNVTNLNKRFDVFVNVKGGGTTGQAGAIMLGLARALAKVEPGSEAALREHQMLTRDPRKVERKKYGKPGARKSFQFSKR